MAKEKLTNEQMELLFDTMEKINSGDIDLQEGVDKLLDKIGIFSETSYKFLYNTFKNMKNGTLYKKRPNIEMTKFFIEKFFEKDGREGLKKALNSARENIIYYYNYTNDKSKGLLDICVKISKSKKIPFPPIIFSPEEYTKKNFLEEVYITEKEYDKLKNLILDKKNIILQGSAGVGKSYAAKRLAYSIIGEKDNERVKMIQFHQSYSYEDFIIGYRPTESGFELKEGVFYKFCKEAEMDENKENKYFLIIDEINRGNISKIFGELFMLIENDKRGEEYALELVYKDDEKFFVPENLYIIGLMNTADRSLAMLDYALRRRFAFYDMKPAFESEQFKEYQKNLKNSKFDNLIKKVEELNEVIKEDLGEGFCIGHSYFCNLETVEIDKLSLIIEFELIPLLKEYWFDDKEKVKKWEDELENSIK
ncbi:AAA family ATPase [uncultured Brachyspira sp.]|uniref:AAA family ATPase n=1 Tax=uncultured Brachyspira sp. TaxID=221953 RepID=UPI002589A040|nr:AAA family ATPase [uncultured Brachyspira sp.]